MYFKRIPQALITLVAILAGTLAFGSSEGNFERTLKVTGAVDMEVSSSAGNINVKTGTAGAVSVKGHVKVSDNFLITENTQAKLQRILANPPIEQNGNIIKIGRIDDPELRRNVSITYDVVTQVETRLSSKTGSGDQNVDGVRGPLNASTGSGQLKLVNIGSEVRANTGSGDIEIDNVKGGVQANTGSGRISANRIAGAFDAHTGSGEVSLEQTAPGDVKIGTGSGSVALKGIKGALSVGTGSGEVRANGEVAGNWKIESGSGSVHVEVPVQAAFNLYARSSSGRITVDNHVLAGQSDINRREIHGKVRGGGHSIDLRTSSGDIVVR